MTNDQGKPLWWSSATIRLSHPELEPARLTEILKAAPSIAFRPGESKVPHGECRSAGYWCTEHRADEPTRPDHAFVWAERFVSERQEQIQVLLSQGYHIDVYIGIFSNILALGFEVPATPTLWQLGITVGVEYFSP
jgi:hypothetical protein